jgi:hypothetical protein
MSQLFLICKNVSECQPIEQSTDLLKLYQVFFFAFVEENTCTHTKPLCRVCFGLSAILSTVLRYCQVYVTTSNVYECFCPECHSVKILCTECFVCAKCINKLSQWTMFHVTSALSQSVAPGTAYAEWF